MFIFMTDVPISVLNQLNTDVTAVSTNQSATNSKTYDLLEESSEN